MMRFMFLLPSFVKNGNVPRKTTRMHPPARLPTRFNVPQTTARGLKHSVKNFLYCEAAEVDVK
jgi:hypothetical protein